MLLLQTYKQHSVFVSTVSQQTRLRGYKQAVKQEKLRKTNSYVERNKQTAIKAQASLAASQDVKPAELLDWVKEAQQLDTRSPTEIVDHALATFGDDVAIAFSGAEDVAVIEHAALTGRPYRVFSLDTGRLNPETYQLFDQVEKRFNIHIEYTFPDTQECVDLVRSKGMFSFYEDGHTECCRIRKVRPLRRQLKTLKAWITGQRRDQSPGTRTDVQAVEVDPVFEGLQGGQGSLIKYNPLYKSTSNEVWNFLRIQDTPVNALHNKGYDSLGCEPCTRPVMPNQHEREGRWWWEDSTAKECGLHSGNIKQLENGNGAGEVQDLFQSEFIQNLNKQEFQKLMSEQRDSSYLIVIYAPWCQYSQAMEANFTELAKEFGKNNSGIKVAKFNGDVERDYIVEQFKFKSFPTIMVLPKWSKSYVKFNSERRTVDAMRMWTQSVA